MRGRANDCASVGQAAHHPMPSVCICYLTLCIGEVPIMCGDSGLASASGRETLTSPGAGPLAELWRHDMSARSRVQLCHGPG